MRAVFAAQLSLCLHPAAVQRQKARKESRWLDKIPIESARIRPVIGWN